MKHLIKTNELLLEPSFLMFARQVYEGFIFLDEVAFLVAKHEGETFEMTLDSWYQRCKAKEPTRIYADSVVTFREYAGLVAQGRIRKDWKIFEDGTKDMTNKVKEAAIHELVQEVGRVREITKTRPYLEPIQKNIIDTLNSIDAHYKMKPTMSKDDIIHEQERIVWNAPNTLLYALILDLKGAQLENNRKCLSASYPALIKLIVDNFVDANGKPFTTKDVGTYLRQTPKRIAEKIRIDVNDRVKVPLPPKKR